MLKVPLVPDTLWYGCGRTTMYDFIQPWTSHLILNGVSSGLSNFLVVVIGTGCPSLNAEFTTGMACTLCSVASLFLIWIDWPACTACTCGLYWQPFWSRKIGRASCRERV